MGMWFRTVGWYETEFDGCPQPAVALLVRANTAAEATATVRALRRRGLSPGYPWVVSEPNLGVDGDGIAVVVGLFATVADAQAWRSRSPDLTLVAAPVLTQAAALERARQRFPVTHVVAPSPVAAYAYDDVRGLNPDDPHAIDAIRPLCFIEPDTVFRPTSVGVRGHAWEPVSCGARGAVVPQEATLTRAVVCHGRDGQTLVHQVTDVACDCALYTTWTLVDGRRTRPRRSTECPSGC